MINRVAQNWQTFSDQTAKCCIWMTAGVISYKLCPMDFNCDECEFDAAMLRQKNRGDRPGEKLPPGHPQL